MLIEIKLTSVIRIRAVFPVKFPAEFSFFGPYRVPLKIGSMDKCLRIADIIQDAGVPNYAQTRFPLASGLNIAELEHEFRDYPDSFILQYLKFGFPISLVQSHQLSKIKLRIITLESSPWVQLI